MKKTKKYTHSNGILTINPDYSREQSQNRQTIIPTAHPVIPLAIICSQEDISSINEIQIDNTQENIPLSTLNTIREMQSPEYLSYFNVTADRNLFEELCTYFIRYEVPIGLLTKLMALKNYRLNFMIDDSGSMSCETDV